ncbi:DUF6318 family protein [Arcanobacterium phocae]|uniref:DUF6318 family protein n=1 Tax=Arcanobacterium phocae TaxID=131112 RepID=UPI001C0F216F|nr:DUF6318 family protein [Arcanobacterium phocae]
MSTVFSSCADVQQSSPNLDSTVVKARQEHTIPPRPVLEAPAAPELSGEARVDAVAVAEHFVMFYPYMLKTGDTSYWEKHSGPECKFCQEVLAGVRTKNRTGAWVDGTLSIQNKVLRVVAEDAKSYQVDFQVVRHDVVEHKTSGDHPIADGAYRVVVDIQGITNWEISKFQIGKESE